MVFDEMSGALVFFVGSVVYAHPMYGTAFAIAGIPLTQPIMPGYEYDFSD